jgi:hypothetical protein
MLATLTTTMAISGRATVMNAAPAAMAIQYRSMLSSFSSRTEPA